MITSMAGRLLILILAIIGTWFGVKYYKSYNSKNSNGVETYDKLLLKEHKQILGSDHKESKRKLILVGVVMFLIGLVVAISLIYLLLYMGDLAGAYRN